MHSQKKSLATGKVGSNYQKIHRIAITEYLVAKTTKREKGSRRGVDWTDVAMCLVCRAFCSVGNQRFLKAD